MVSQRRTRLKQLGDHPAQNPYLSCLLFFLFFSSLYFPLSFPFHSFSCCGFHIKSYMEI